jgi:hypothetical protein
MDYNENYKKLLADAEAGIPSSILKLIIIARDEDPDFSRYTSLREVVEAMIKDKNLKDRIVGRYTSMKAVTLN